MAKAQGSVEENVEGTDKDRSRLIIVATGASYGLLLTSVDAQGTLHPSSNPVPQPGTSAR